jgi:hypothetical protein
MLLRESVLLTVLPKSCMRLRNLSAESMLFRVCDRSVGTWWVPVISSRIFETDTLKLLQHQARYWLPRAELNICL